MIGRPSGVPGRSPAQVRRTSRCARAGTRALAFAKRCASPAGVDSGWNPAASMVEPTIASSPRGTTYTPLPCTIACSAPAGHGKAAICPRTGSTEMGRGTPSIRPLHAPAAMITCAARLPGPRIARAGLGGVEPVDQVSLLPLPRHLPAKRTDLVLGEGDPRDPIPPERQVDPGALLQLRRHRIDQFAASEAEFVERVFAATVGLGGEHPGGGAPRLAFIGAAVDDQD